ncbi:MAG: leucine-rich repeat domain-containing protein [Deltaproteobacteria bacterium]|nr:leucine-rich repeat domain-containing protein [Deltaproteobacteria bacterium]
MSPIDRSWYLRFVSPAPVAPATLSRALSEALGIPVTRIDGLWQGDPMSGFWRAIQARITRADVSLVMELGTESSPAPPEVLGVDTLVVRAILSGGPLTSRDSLWKILAQGLARLGYADLTLATGGRHIIEEYALLGHTDAVHDLCALSLQLHIDALRSEEFAWHLNVDDVFVTALDEVLDAIVRPQDRLGLSLSRAGLREVPAKIQRFATMRSLTLRDNAIELLADSDPLFALSQLEALDLTGNPLRAISAAGLARLPKLNRLVLGDTPLATDPVALDSLRAAFAGRGVRLFLGSSG